MMKRGLCVAAASMMLLGLAATPARASVQSLTVSANLIRNGNAEAAAGSPDGSVVPVPNWAVTTGTTFTAVQYGGSGGFPAPTDPGPRMRGANFLAGGPGADVTVATQKHFVPAKFRTAVDAGTATFALQGYLGGWSSQGDNATVRVDWLNSHAAVIGSSSIGPVTPTDRADVTGLKLRTTSGATPVGARQVVITLTMTRTDGSYNDGYADNLTLKITMPAAG